jgi:hypothetical protein
MLTGTGLLCPFCRSAIVRVLGKHVVDYAYSYWFWCPACHRSERITKRRATQERLVKRGQQFSDSEWYQGYKVVKGRRKKQPHKRT